MKPKKVVASFDSASVLHAAIASSLRGNPFSNLGNPEPIGRLVRVAGRLPWPALRELYRRVGGAEGIPPDRLQEVDLGAVAESFAEGIPRRKYSAAMIGASNGAMAHLAAALQVPWLPQTVLIPVHRLGDPHRPDQALSFGERWGPRLLQANPDVVLHQMHDAAQDELMTARMAYFRVKWRRLPAAYAQFLSQLPPHAPVIVIDDRLSWPVTRVDDRHWFQTGGLGGLSPLGHLAEPHAPAATDEAPEAEWGCDPEFIESVRQWCADHDHPVILIRYRGPQQAAHPTAMIFRDWLRRRGEAAETLIVPSFVLGDPWRTLNRALIPYWTYFPIKDAVAALDHHLQRSGPYQEVLVMAFQHGVDSPGTAGADDFAAVIRRHGAEPTMLAVDPDRWPHDIGSLARYGSALDALPPARRPWSPITTSQVVDGLRDHLSDTGESLLADVGQENRRPDDGSGET